MNVWLTLVSLYRSFEHRRGKKYHFRLMTDHTADSCNKYPGQSIPTDFRSA